MLKKVQLVSRTLECYAEPRLHLVVHQPARTTANSRGPLGDEMPPFAGVFERRRTATEETLHLHTAEVAVLIGHRPFKKYAQTGEKRSLRFLGRGLSCNRTATWT